MPFVSVAVLVDVAPVKVIVTPEIPEPLTVTCPEMEYPLQLGATAVAVLEKSLVAVLFFALT